MPLPLLARSDRHFADSKPWRSTLAYGVIAGIVAGATFGTACYPTDNGLVAPTDALYFPAGLAVSSQGRALYVVNSDFDLQFSSGTLQAYDLQELRRQGVAAAPAVGTTESPTAVCPWDATALMRRCTPSVFAKSVVRIGAFSTDLQLSLASFPSAGGRSRRLYSPTRGDASLTWVNVGEDGAGDPFALDCDAQNDTCGNSHRAGNNADEPDNTRKITMPGEPFGLAQSPDSAALVITHQTSDHVSLLATGIGSANDVARSPSLQFILDKVALGGVGITAIPHDPGAHPDDAPPHAAFLSTSRSVAELTLLRYFDDDGTAPAYGSSVRRPFLTKEGAYTVTGNAGGTDSRGIAIDPSPRLGCRARINADTTLSASARATELVRCARIPARIFVASRSPASLLFGEVGEITTETTGPYNDDKVVFNGSIPLASGPSRVYIAPIVDTDGALALRVFIACYDASIVYVIDPDTMTLESTIPVNSGPFAMAFDPFDLEAAATHAKVPSEDLTKRRYRFGYLASFTESFVQAIDLNRAAADRVDPTISTFEKVLFSLGTPRKPKGST